MPYTNCCYTPEPIPDPPPTRVRKFDFAERKEANRKDEIDLACQLLRKSLEGSESWQMTETVNLCEKHSGKTTAWREFEPAGVLHIHFKISRPVKSTRTAH